MRISLSTNVPTISRLHRAFYADQVPFANSLALNNLSKQFQADQVRNMNRTFNVRRRTFVNRAVKIKPFATKRRPYAQIQIEPPGGPSRADILAKFEEGGTKRPRTSRLAVPDEVRRTGTGFISKANRPRALERRKRVFAIKRPGGQGGIYQRIGRRRNSEIRRLYLFAPEARIPATLGFYDQSKRTADRWWPTLFKRAFTDAVATRRS